MKALKKSSGWRELGWFSTALTTALVLRTVEKNSGPISPPAKLLSTPQTTTTTRAINTGDTSSQGLVVLRGLGGLGSLGGGDCYAVMLPLSDINTDPRRFQNRQDAFSEASADRVATDYDPNQFDPIVVWVDPTNSKTYVLSGHSRLEGMHRRGEKSIPARYFKGNEAAAIQFARTYANRAATQETITEDITAFKLMRDGAPEKNIEPVTKAELQRTFPGKATKLEAYSHLDPAGKFMAALSTPDRSNFPYIETRAMWVGALRKLHPEMTNIHEADCFNYLYLGGAIKQDKENFERTVETRLAAGKERLFPECGDHGCEKIENLEERGQFKELYKQMALRTKYLNTIRERLATTNPVQKVWTKPENIQLKRLATEYENELKDIKRDLNIQEKAPGLFGIKKYKIENKPLILEENTFPEVGIINKGTVPTFDLRLKRIPGSKKFDNPQDFAKYAIKVWPANTMDLYETMLVIFLDNGNNIIGVYPHSKGAISNTTVDIRLIMAAAIKVAAAAMIIVHNHPGGNPEPSLSDIQITKQIKEASGIMGIILLDSLIISRNGSYSIEARMRF